MEQILRATKEGVEIFVRATPRATRSAIVGLVDVADGGQALAVRVAAPPSEGAANAALAEVLAKALGVRKSDVWVAAGETSRIKRVAVRLPAAEVAARLTAHLA